MTTIKVASEMARQSYNYRLYGEPIKIEFISEVPASCDLHPTVEMVRLSEVEIVTMVNLQISTIDRDRGSRYLFRERTRVTIDLT